MPKQRAERMSKHFIRTIPNKDVVDSDTMILRERLAQCD